MSAIQLSPRESVRDMYQLLNPIDYNTIVFEQALADEKPVQLDSGPYTGSGTEICRIEGVSIRLTGHNAIYVKLPGLGRRFVYDYRIGEVAVVFKAANKVNVYFDRAFDFEMPKVVIDKLGVLLARKVECEIHEMEDDLANPPIDILEDNAEETPSTLDLLR